MIIVKLSGGLGNQLFQYAFGKALAAQHHSKVLFDAFGYQKAISTETPRKLQVQHIMRDVLLAEEEDIKALSISKQMLTLGHWLKKGNIYPFKQLVYEKRQFFFDSRALVNYDSGYFIGYWQSYKYFNSIKTQLLHLQNTYAVSPPPLAIDFESSVLVHVRRGDYIHNKLYVTLDNEYYKTAIAKLQAEVGRKLEIIVVSDEPDWCKINMQWDTPVRYIEAYSDLEQFVIMTGFKYFVIANSTFSWWAAYLSKQESKKIIAPSRWMNIRSFRVADFFPEDWCMI